MAVGKYKKWLTDDGITALQTWARLGLTDENIANNMGINVSTLYTYKNKYNEIKEALKYAKEEADAIVENALYKRAVGFTYEESTRERKYIEATQTFEMVTTKIITKMVVPDTTAQIFWLKNRNQSRWRDKIEGDDLSNRDLLTALSSVSKGYK